IITLCATVRHAHPDLAIVVIGPGHDAADTVAALDAGADAYLSRPYEPAILLARIQALLRPPAHADPQATDAVVRVGRTQLHPGQLTFIGSAGSVVHLTPTEMQLLAALMRHAGMPLTRERLLREVWEEEPGHADNRVDVYIRRLRAKLEAD